MAVTYYEPLNQFYNQQDIVMPDYDTWSGVLNKDNYKNNADYTKIGDTMVTVSPGWDMGDPYEIKVPQYVPNASFYGLYTTADADALSQQLADMDTYWQQQFNTLSAGDGTGGGGGTTPGYEGGVFQPPPDLGAWDSGQGFKPTVVGYDPVLGEITDQMLVEKRLQGLLDTDNPYIQQARTQAMEQANSRGLLNSSIAAGNAQRAAIEAAMPIAQQDAEALYKQSLANQDAATAARQFAANAENQASITETQNLAQQYQMYLDTTYRDHLMNVDASIRERLAGIDQRYALELETLKQEYAIMENLDSAMAGLYADTIKSISTFLDNPDMTTAQQQTGLSVIVGNLKAGLNFLAGLSSTPGTTTK